MNLFVKAAFHRKNQALTLTLPFAFNPGRVPVLVSYDHVNHRIIIIQMQTYAVAGGSIAAHEETGKCELRLCLQTAAVFGAFLAAGVPPIMNSAPRRKTKRFLDTRRVGDNILEVYL